MPCRFGMTLYKLIIVGFGGLIGSIARYVTIKGIDEKLNSIFPYGTLLVNILGSFILGLIYALAVKKIGLTENWRIFLGGGFCGGFTTFSTFAWESVNLFEHKNLGVLSAYLIISLMLGCLAIVFGGWVGRSI
jgi:fluoride exporter